LQAWAGWFVDYDEKFILVVEVSQVDDLLVMRIGLEQCYGICGGTKSWTDVLEN
jgi:hypothetical protein